MGMVGVYCTSLPENTFVIKNCVFTTVNENPCNRNKMVFYWSVVQAY